MYQKFNLKFGGLQINSNTEWANFRDHLLSSIVPSLFSSRERETRRRKNVPAQHALYLNCTALKGTVQRDGRGYKSGINRQVSLLSGDFLDAQ